MTEVLPTPRSITIASLISLYSDPYSPLYTHDVSSDSSFEANKDWPSRLSTLIQQLVQEDDGYIFEKEDLQTDLNENDELADLMNLLDNTASADKSKSHKQTTCHSSAIQLHNESLSTLLRRLDHAYTNNQVNKVPTLPSRALLSKLQSATTSIEHLSMLIDDFHALLEGRGVSMSNNPITLDGDSSFGIYLRRLCLGMEESPFEYMSQLWVRFRMFVAEADTDTSGKVSTVECDAWMPSSNQVENIVRKTCFNINMLHINSLSHDNADDNSKCIPSSQATDEWKNLLDSHPETPSLHFLLFYKSLLQNERPATLESLHRYFDYGMIHERKERVERSLAGANAANGGAGSSYSGGITTSVDNEPRRHPNNANASPKIYKEPNIMQYAAILLAQTYHRFGYKSLALQATQEAIRVAQQSNDEECVLFAQSWLAYIQNDDIHMLRRCRDRALEKGLGSLAAGATLELGRREGYCWDEGQNDGLETEENDGRRYMAWKSIQNAGKASSAASGGGTRGLMIGSGSSALHRGGVGTQSFTDVDNMTSPEVLSILGRQNLAISGLWDSTGHSSMALLSSSAALHGFGRDLISEDVAFATRRILTSFSYGPGLDLWTTTTSLDGVSMQRDCCIYRTSLNSLSSLSGQGSDSKWIQSKTSILHEWSVRSHDINIARNLQCLLANHASFPSSPSNAVKMTIISLSRSTHFHMQVNDFAAAKGATRHACSLAAKHSLRFHQGWQLLQLALIDLEASISAPIDNASVECALPALLECLDLADNYSMDPLRAIALATLAKILLCMGRFRRARAMLIAVMPLLVQNGHIWFQAEASLTLAKCNLAEAHGVESAGRPPAAAFIQLENAASLFNRIEDVQRLRQIYYIQAILYNTIPHMQSKRDKAAEKFSELTVRRRIGSKMWTVVHEILTETAS